MAARPFDFRDSPSHRSNGRPGSRRYGCRHMKLENMFYRCVRAASYLALVSSVACGSSSDEGPTGADTDTDTDVGPGPDEDPEQDPDQDPDPDEDTDGADEGSTGDSAGNASVRVFHAAIRSENADAGFGAGTALELDVDVYVDDVLSVETLSLGEASERLEIESGEHAVSIRAAGTEDELFAATATIGAGDSTIVAYNAAADFIGDEVELAIMAIDESALVPDGEGAAFYAVHLDGNSNADDFIAYSGPSSDDAAVQLGNVLTYEDAAGTGVYTVSDLETAYLDADAGDYDGGFACATPDVSAGEGHLLIWGTNSVALPGTTDGSSNAFVLGPDSVGALSPIVCLPQAPAASASVRVFHAAIRSDGNADAGFGAGTALELDVDVYVDDVLGVEGLSLGEASGRLELQPGEHAVSIRAAGTEDELFSANATIGAGSSTIVAYNSAADFIEDEVELAIMAFDESSIVPDGDGAAFLAVHLDGNSNTDDFIAYSGPSSDDAAVQLGDVLTYEDASGTGVYTVSDLETAYLDADAGDYDGGFACGTPGISAGEGHLLIWGTNSVALPGTTDGSSNAFVLGPDSEGAITPSVCLPQ